METNNLISHVGGVFIYSKNPEKLAKWYEDYLCMKFDSTGGDSPYCYKSYYYNDIDSGKKAYIAWAILRAKESEIITGISFCINYRVLDLEKTVAHLKSMGAEVNTIEVYPEGKFARTNDIDGNLIELWEDTSLYK